MTNAADIKTVYLDPMAEMFNEKFIGHVYALYQHNAALHLPWGDHYGREAVIREVTALQAAFPDLDYQTLGTVTEVTDGHTLKILEQFQWSGTHTGFGIYGQPTNQPVTISGLRLLKCRKGRIIEEWLQDDRLGIIGQLDLDPREVSQRMEQAAPVDFTWEAGMGEIQRTAGQAPPAPCPTMEDGEDTPEVITQTLIQKVWNWRMVGAVKELFSADCSFDLPCGVACETLEDYPAHILNRLAAFSDLTLSLDKTFQQKKADTRCLALRWTLIGTHDGFSSYGAPSGTRFCIPGLSRIEIRDQHIVNYVERLGELALFSHSQKLESQSSNAIESTNNETIRENTTDE